MVYSKPKVGKTTILSHLENCLILDFEKGTEFVESMSIQVESLDQLRAIGEAIKEKGYPYKYIAVDTVTKLEDLCLGLALKLYKQTPLGKSFSGESVLTLPNGAGYYWLRLAYEKIITYIETFAPNVILVGHVLDKITEVSGKEVNSQDIDLTGKIKRIACQDADAIAYMFREGNNTYLNFASSETIACGARPAHLKGKKILIAESNDAGEITSTHWNQIFID